MKKKILIIDDDPTNFNMYVSLLDFLAYEIQQSPDGQKGLEKAREEKPAIILLDSHIPHKDVYQTTYKFKSDDELKNIPLIVLTSFATPSDNKEAMDAGANGIIEKPLRPETFASQMESIVRSIK
jgi:CheY-like chemotaxis protein